MKQYETGFLLSPQLTEEEAEGIISQMADIIAQTQGKMAKVEKWGKRRLPIALRKFHDAFFVFFHYEAARTSRPSWPGGSASWTRSCAT